MSNHLAIATVTAALRRTLQASVVQDVAGAAATAVRPDESNATLLPNPGVNIFLYQVTPNAAWRNMDLPSRNTAGQLIQRPRIALDLHYLLTFYGDDLELFPQRVLGSVVRTLHSRPILTREAIENTIADPSFNPILDGSDLAEEVELVKFTPIPFSLEEISKLWSVMLQTAYTLSMAYMGTVVLIEAAASTRRVLPVRVRNLTARPFQHAEIESIDGPAGPRSPLVADDTITLRGRQLSGEAPSVRVGEALLTPDAVAPDQVTLTLTHPDLRAGVQGVQMRYATGSTSNVAPAVIRPRVTTNGGGAYQVSVVDISGVDHLRVILSPGVGAQQQATVYLNGLAPTPGPGTAFSLPAAPRTADTDTLDFDITGVVPGDYLVRVEVGGAESLLDFDAGTGVYDEPAVTIP